MNIADMVREFHETYGCKISDKPDLLDRETQDLRNDLIFEECDELLEALDKDDIIAVADALADLAYVVYGTALTFGIPLDAVLAEVHRSNMSKLGADGKPIYREDGKVLKGPGYTPPNLGPILGVTA